MKATIFALALMLLATPARAAANEATIGDLQSAINHALQHNPEIRAARLAVEQRDAIWVELRGRVLPNVGIEAFYSRRDEGLLPSLNGQTFGQPEDWNAHLYVRQLLFGGGAAIGSNKQQRALQTATLAALDQTVSRVVFNVQAAYYAAILAEAEAEVQSDAVRLLESQLQNTRQKRDAGALSDFEVLQAEVELANARVTALRAKNDVRLKAQELRNLLGEQAKLGALARDFAAAATTPPSLAYAVERARSQRPEVRLANANREAAAASRHVARAGYMPIVDLQAQYGYQLDTFGSSLSDALGGWQIRLGGAWSLFDGFSSSGKARQARIATTLSQVELDHTAFFVALDVERAHASLLEALELYNATQQVERSASDSLRLAQVRFNAGAATQLDVFAAQVALTQARSNALRARYDVSVAGMGLQRAMGELSIQGR